MPAFEGKVAVITGASRGLGAGLARAFADHGLRLGLCARGDPALPDGPDVVCARVDVRDPKAVDEFAARVTERLGGIDLWINNAGVLEPIKPLRDVTAEQLREHLDVNVVGVFNGTRAFVRQLRASARSGVLVNVSSGAGRKPYAGWSAYCAAKAAVDRMTECVQLEEADVVRAYSVAPGVINTGMQALIRASSADDFPEVERFRERKRQGAYNTPEYIAEHLLALAFDPARHESQVILRLPAEKELDQPARS